MLSLRLPIPNENAITPQKPSTPLFSRHRVSRNSQTRLSSLSSSSDEQRIVRARATAEDAVAVKEEEEGGEKNIVAPPEEEEEEEELPEGLSRELMPKHVAIIMDGNGRWARQRDLPPGEGHRAGVETLKTCVELCWKWGIKVLTVFAFSYDNWMRPKVEVEFLMSLFEGVIKSELDKFAREGVRISVIGDSTRLPKSLQKLITEAEERTKNHSRLQIIVAVSYSGKYDVVQACKSIAAKVEDGVVAVDDIDEAMIEQELETNCTEFPYPDLMIRTSGELRVSNFLLWQLAYTELFFAPELWPDFGRDRFVEALVSFQKRQRRYGGRN